jgi:hypothetical protein
VLTSVFQGLRTAARDEVTAAAPPHRPGKTKQLVPAHAPGLYWSITLKWILPKHGVRVWTASGNSNRTIKKEGKLPHRHKDKYSVRKGKVVPVLN